MADPVLFLSRPAGEALATIHAAPGRSRAPAAWLLLLAAAFMATAALTCAAVVILGAPGGGSDVVKGDAVRQAIAVRMR